MKKLGLVVLVLALVLVLAGCPGGSDDEDTQPPADENGNDAEPEVNTRELTADISNQWKDSGHAFAIPEEAERANCNLCHDGRGFSDQIAEPDIAGGNPPHATGIDCQACHTGKGAELMESGSVEVPFSDEAITAGTAATCVYCHNGRRNPGELLAQSEAGELTDFSYPHNGAQAALLSGQGGMELADTEYQSTTAHANIEDNCVVCHMPETDDGYVQHTFAMDEDYIDQTCGTCHSGITTYNLNGVQDDVQGMLDDIEAAILEATGATEIATSHGAFVFTDANGDPITEISPEAYTAAYNWSLIQSDGSLGVHNPAYARSLLQESLNALNGAGQ